MSEYPYKTQPYPYQRDALRKSAARTNFALFMAPRTGKSFVVLNTAGYNFREGRINGLFIVAPNLVHKNWIYDEVPAHLPDCIARTSLAWEAKKSKKLSPVLDAMIADRSALAIFAMNIDALITKDGKAAALRFLRARRALMTIDESADVAHMSSQRSRMARKLARLAVMRRILDGTPAAEHPLELYAQMECLKHGILGFETKRAFEDHFAEWEEREIIEDKPFRTIKKDADGKPQYKNLDVLWSRTMEHAVRVTIDEAMPDLPPKLFTPRRFALSDEQRAAYEALRTVYVAQITDDKVMTSQLAAVRTMRLQQIACGYARPDAPMLFDFDEEPEEQPYEILPGASPRVDACMEELGTEPVLIFARFKMDFVLLAQRFREQGITFGEFHGEVSDDGKHRAKSAFQAGDLQALLINAQSGGRGLTFSAARRVIWYSNYFRLRLREQGEDRPVWKGMTYSVPHIDLIADDTVDERIVRALRHRRSIWEGMSGDLKKEWF